MTPSDTGPMYRQVLTYDAALARRLGINPDTAEHSRVLVSPSSAACNDRSVAHTDSATAADLSSPGEKVGEKEASQPFVES